MQLREQACLLDRNISDARYVCVAKLGPSSKSPPPPHTNRKTAYGATAQRSEAIDVRGFCTNGGWNLWNAV